MNALKERIPGAVTVMNNEKAEKIWNIIVKEFSDPWSNIDEEEPDEWDLKMLDDIKNNSECNEFV